MSRTSCAPSRAHLDRRLVHGRERRRRGRGVVVVVEADDGDVAGNAAARARRSPSTRPTAIWSFATKTPSRSGRASSSRRIASAPDAGREVAVLDQVGRRARRSTSASRQPSRRSSPAGMSCGPGDRRDAACGRGRSGAAWRRCGACDVVDVDVVAPRSLGLSGRPPKTTGSDRASVRVRVVVGVVRERRARRRRCRPCR